MKPGIISMDVGLLFILVQGLTACCPKSEARTSTYLSQIKFFGLQDGGGVHTGSPGIHHVFLRQH